jgi:hypothetical protein
MKNWIVDFFTACQQELFFRVWTWRTDRELRKHQHKHCRRLLCKDRV